MNPNETEKFERLDEIFELNFQLTRLYKSYLELCPEVITEEIMSELCSDGEIDVKDAFAALLSQLFDVDIDRSARDRRFFREYLEPSVRVLDAKKYTENPYYKNVKVRNVKDGAWELRLESYPAYRGVICGDMVIFDDMREYAPLGFFTEKFEFPAVLENGNEWMTLTPVDMDTCESAIEKSRGRTVTFGLGLGYFAYMASLKPEVSEVTVVELSADVIRLFKKHLLPFFPYPEKIKIVNADAFEYAEKTMPGECFDFAFVDTWRDASDGAPMYKKMKALEPLSPRTEFEYWIENFLISRIRAEKYEKFYQERESRGACREISYDELLKDLKTIP